MGNIGSISGRRDACTHVTRDIAGNGSVRELRPDEIELAEEATELLQCYGETNAKSSIQQAPESFFGYTCTVSETLQVFWCS